MIYSTRQIHLMRMGLPVTLANGGGKSSSSSANTSNTYNTDKRIATDSGFVATEGSSINATFQSVDADLVKKALDTVSASDAISGDGFARLLDSQDTGFDKLLSVAEKLTTKTQDNATALTSRYQADVLDAYSRSQSDKAGGIDQKTMIVLGITGAAAVAYVVSQRKH